MVVVGCIVRHSCWGCLDLGLGRDNHLDGVGLRCPCRCEWTERSHGACDPSEKQVASDNRPRSVSVPVWVREMTYVGITTFLTNCVAEAHSRHALCLNSGRRAWSAASCSWLWNGRGRVVWRVGSGIQRGCTEVRMLVRRCKWSSHRKACSIH